jgi:HSP20 family protein
MAIIRFAEQPRFMNPWAEFERIRHGLDELSKTLIAEGKAQLSATVYPPLNITETADSLFIKAELPGVTAEDLDISVEGDTLTLHGKRNHRTAKNDEKRPSYHRREIETGSFSRAITLPTKVNLENMQAKLQDGILSVTLFKAQEVTPKKINIITDK